MQMFETKVTNKEFLLWHNFPIESIIQTFEA